MTRAVILLGSQGSTAFSMKDPPPLLLQINECDEPGVLLGVGSYQGGYQTDSYMNGQMVDSSDGLRMKLCLIIAKPHDFRWQNWEMTSLGDASRPTSAFPESLYECLSTSGHRDRRDAPTECLSGYPQRTEEPISTASLKGAQHPK